LYDTSDGIEVLDLAGPLPIQKDEEEKELIPVSYSVMSKMLR